MMLKRRHLISTIPLLLPALTLYIVFLLYPIFQSIFMSLFQWNGIASVPMSFVGIDNFVKIFSSNRFWASVGNSVWFMAGGFLVLMPLAFLLSLVITSNMRGARFLKSAFFMPVVLPITAVGLVWTYLLTPNGGLFASVLEAFGLPAINFLGDPKLAIKTVVLVNEWIYAGLNMLIFAAGMVAIPDELFEAANIDGANRIQQIWHIMIPNLKESFKIFSVMCVTGCLRSFDLIYVMTGGGPAHATEMPATLLYNEAFKYQNFGGGNAIGVFILVVGLTLSAVLNKFLTSEES